MDIQQHMWTSCLTTDEAVAMYDKVGFVMLDSGLTDEVLDGLERDMLNSSAKSYRGGNRYCNNDHLNIRLDSYWALLTHSLSFDHPLYAFLKAKFGDGWFLDSTLGGDVVLPGAGHSRATLAHSDWSTEAGSPHESMLAISCCVRNITKEMGPMELLVDDKTWVGPELCRGQLLLRNVDVIHRGRPNVSTIPRCLPAFRVFLPTALRKGYRPFQFLPANKLEEFPSPMREHSEFLLKVDDDAAMSASDASSQ